MALKFLNKKGWHTGSLRNIENVWKAEQKHDAEQRKLEELRKQIHEERERAEFRQLQEQAGLIPRQERLEFLYESGLAVGKGSSSFKELESLPTKVEPEAAAASSSASGKQPEVPGALFDEKDKPQTANEAWRKLHSDPLLMIRQREQEALARVKNNPVQMAMIRKSVQTDKDVKKEKKRHHRKKSKHHKHSSSENESDHKDPAPTVEKKRGSHHKSKSKRSHTPDEVTSEDDTRRKKHRYENDPKDRRPKEYYSERHEHRSHYNSSDKPPRNDDRSHYNSSDKPPRNDDRSHYNSLDKPPRNDDRSHYNSSDKPPRNEASSRHRKPVKLSEEERAARLREMQEDAETHEQQRWRRLKKADDSDAREAIQDRASLGRNFLDATQKSVYGAEKGGSKTIEESVRRRMHYSQRSGSESNAFRRS